MAVEQALVAAKQPLEGELISPLSGFDEGTVLHSRTERDERYTSAPVCIAT
jgi:hypothetical protein